MDYKEIFSRLDTTLPPTAKDRAMMSSFLKEQATAFRAHPDQTTRIAYAIAGMLATRFARNLPEDDPIDEILTIAGELEVNPDNASDLRKELLTKIDAL
jgi:hypothetical protein